MKFRTGLTTFFTFVMLACSAWPQTSNQGALVGTITDPTGAVIPGARVSATNVETGVSHETTTNSVGEYRFGFLTPGSYELKTQADGFFSKHVTDLTVTVGQTLRLDLKLELGRTTETVTVAETSAPLDLDTPARGDVIGTQAIENLPLNGREWIQLATLVPGAQSDNVKRGTYTNKGVEFGFNGARDTFNSYYVDGADSTDAYHNTLISSPALDAIKEFRVETNMYSAQYGRSGGAVIIAVTRSGTNTFHGTLYEYHRNKALDARPPLATQPRSALPNYLFNQFGGSVGGPIVKNKAFFFFSLEKFRQVTPGNLMVTFAPTEAEARGDVSRTRNPYTNQPVVLRDPLTNQVIPGNVLPDRLIHPIGRTLMDIWSQYKPNYNDPGGFLNLRFFRGSRNSQDKYLNRIDYTPGPKNSFSGTFDFNDYKTGSVYHTAYGDKNYKENARTGAVTWTHTFSPTLVNDLKGNYTYSLQGSQFALNDQSYGAKWGFYPELHQGNGSPRVLMYTAGSQVFGIGNSGDLYHKQHTIFARDNLAWVKGKHTIYFGGDYRRQLFRWTSGSGQTTPYFGLLDGSPGQENMYWQTGSTFTDLLTAMPNRLTVGGGGGKLMPFSRNAFSGYVQDNWKITRRLTLSLGLRYDFEAPFSIDNGQFLGLNFATGLPRYCEGAPRDKLSILNFKYEIGGPCRDHNPDYRNFSPRVGFAFRPFGDDKTVVRGGYGIFFTSENAYNTTYGGWVQPFAGQFDWYPGLNQWRQPANAAVNPLLDSQFHWTTLDKKPYGLEYVQGRSMGFFYPTIPYYPTAYVQHYNLTVGRDIGWKTAMEIGYVGSHGINLNGPSTIFNYDPTLRDRIVSANPQLPNWGLRMKGFSSYYNGLQVSARKQASHGVWFLANYTWSHAMTDMSNDDTNETLLTDSDVQGNIIARRRVNADYDYQQRFTFSGTWALPFGRGKAFGRDWNPVLDGILGGWTLNSIITFQGGFPFTVYDPALRFPDRICDGNLPKSQRSASRWYDYSCFVTHPSRTITDPITGLRRTISLNGNSPPNVIRGPGRNNIDLGASKQFNITERVKMQLRGEFFNAFNRLNLQAPPGNYFFNTASGAQITRAARNRDVQIALRLSF